MSAKIKLNAASGGGSVSLKAPSTTTSNAAVELQLPVADGSANTFLKTDGSGALSFAEAGGGKVLQAVTASTSSTVTSTTASYIDTGLTASITISANSKVLVLVTQNYETKRTKNFNAGDIRLLRGSTNLWVSTNQKMLGFGDGDNDAKTLLGVLSISYLDTGASTGSNTYKTQQRVQSEDDNPRFRTQDDSNPSVITLLEIGA